MKIKSYVYGKWVEGSGSGKKVSNAVTGEPIGEVTSEGIDFQKVLEYGRTVGQKNLEKLTFHERAILLKEVALKILANKDSLYEVSRKTGATNVDSRIDIEGGAGTFFTYSGVGRRDFPNDTVYTDGTTEVLSKSGSFVGRHIMTPLRGVALHINAFNFPCWGMLEKIAPSILAGMPCVVKPATPTCYLTEKLVECIIEANLLPEGSLQLICGSTGNAFEYLTSQDVVTFTGSKQTADMLKSHPAVVRNSVRFNAEADSLNCSILTDELTEDSVEIDLFVKEVVKEMTTKAGQKCTAIRRAIVPESLVPAVTKKIKERVAKIKIGDPNNESTRMGALAGNAQLLEVKEKVELLKKDSELVFGGDQNSLELSANEKNGAFFPPTLFYCKFPLETSTPHEIEAFGPVCTLMPYSNDQDAIVLANKGEGSLVASIFTSSEEKARNLTIGIAPYHGRVLVLTEACAKESTGHGSPLPTLTHGGPGRAGGGEELGGKRAVFHYMQRTAIQGTPESLSKISGQWVRGAKEVGDRVHPFKKYFEELQVGETFNSPRRTITDADIVNFAGISGDYFYAHMDEIAAKDSLFNKRVAHGYFILSAAAGLFVDPAPGPVLANYGLEGLRFVEPVYPGDTINVKLTCQQKIKKSPKPDEKPQGVVHWHVDVFNQENTIVANYTILTLVERKSKE